jgi:hypothetical protein
MIEPSHELIEEVARRLCCTLGCRFPGARCFAPEWNATVRLIYPIIRKAVLVEEVAALEAALEGARDAIASAYVAGCEDVHQEWSEDAYPEFGEAGSDYAAGCDFVAEARAALKGQT